jgi:DNA-binding transcriptional LysR family regulator
MEHTLDVSLFDRSSKGVEPTPYGRALIKRGVAVFDELRQGIREIETIKDPTMGEVHIGATSTIAEVGIVAAVIGQMSQKYPRINFHVVEATPEWLFHELRERSLDLIILLTFDPVASNDIVSEMLYEDRMVIAAAADNPWTRQSRVELAELVDENWTLPEPEHPVTSIVASAFRAVGCEAPRSARAYTRHSAGDRAISHRGSGIGAPFRRNAFPAQGLARGTRHGPRNDEHHDAEKTSLEPGCTAFH